MRHTRRQLPHTTQKKQLALWRRADDNLAPAHLGLSPVLPPCPFKHPPRWLFSQASSWPQAAAAPSPRQIADAIYTGGDIVTMNDPQPTAKRWRSRAARSSRSARAPISRSAPQRPDTRSSTSRGKTLLPGFLDAAQPLHQLAARGEPGQFYAPPAGPGKDVDSIVAELVKFRDATEDPEGEIISAYGYDENVMPDGRLLNRDDLDTRLPGQPGAGGPRLDARRGAQLRGAEEVRLLGGHQDAAGRRHRAQAGHQRALRPDHGDGLPADLRGAAQPTPAQEVEWSKAGQMLYAQAGMTTAHEGATHAGGPRADEACCRGRRQLIDVVAYPFITDLDRC